MNEVSQVIFIELFKLFIYFILPFWALWQVKKLLQ